MIGLLKRYAKWLHTQWPGGIVEKCPVTSENGITTVPGVRIVGDLTGIPLFKILFPHRRRRSACGFIQEPDFRRTGTGADVLDLAIVGGGVAGISAAIEASKAGLRYAVFESTQAFSTLVNFPPAQSRSIPIRAT